MKRFSMVAVLVLLAMACADQTREERRLVEEAEARYEAMAERAREAAERASAEARLRAEEARERAEEAWARAEEARRRLDPDRRERLDEAWEEARRAREQAREAWEEAFRREAEGWERFGEAMEAFGEKMRALGESLGDGVEPVDWRKLEDLLPRRVDGLRRVDVEGERAGALGIHVSRVTGTYEDDDRRLRLSIVDLGTLRGAAMTGIEWLDVHIDRVDRHGFERTQTYRGYPAHLKLERGQGEDRFEAQVIVAERFVVSFELQGSDLSEDDVEDLLEAVDYDDLEELRLAGT
ncbi:hypothetical protein GQ464_001070 [Rhodocaloribacter litoris]|uniref:hypothetical protein n=1 Tax=Rhodocaloribacter litoris TaxID=2558931 RepID=UPI00141E0328|nr:hypothetical protein [Rhodocaloribacter litoris]QXD15567.1 hypothetical protein GQ464_001070 [Rhodocaloribacter litoris]